MYKQMTNEDLLPSSGNSTQYSVETKMGKKSPERGVYVHVTDSLCYTVETRTL